MRVVIVGFPFSGKSTLYSAITGLPRDHLRLGEENLAAVRIPEPRLDWLETLYTARKRTEATIEFVDLPGSQEGDAAKAGLEKHLPTLRQADALLVCVRQFESPSVPAYRERIAPQEDLNLLRDEILLADFLICDTRVEKLEKAIGKPSKDRDAQKHELDLLRACRASLENGEPLSRVLQTPEQEKQVRSFGFLTQKPLLVAVNVGEADVTAEPRVTDPHAYRVFNVCASIEAEIMQIEPSERAAFMSEWGIQALARDRMIRACFDALGMIFFLTAGEEEVRAWPIPRGATAVEAAGKIHSDLARGFIRAETVAYDDLRAAGDMREAKARNKVRQEPKGYVVLDGDIMNIKFNV